MKRVPLKNSIYHYEQCMTIFSAVAILVAVLSWLGMMGEYDVGDAACVNVFCQNLGILDIGDCMVGWAGYLGPYIFIDRVINIKSSNYTSHKNNCRAK